MKINGTITAPISLATSVSAVSWTWLGITNDVLQLVATVVAIITGLYAIRYYKKRNEAERKNKASRR